MKIVLVFLVVETALNLIYALKAFDRAGILVGISIKTAFKALARPSEPFAGDYAVFESLSRKMQISIAY